MRTLEDNTFLLLLISVTLAFGWVLWPFSGAIVWAVVLATVFAPTNRRLLNSMRQRRNLAAVTTVVVIVLIVILPLILIALSLVREATNLYEGIQSGEIDFGDFFQQLLEGLPAWATALLERFGVSNLGDVQESLSGALKEGSQLLATQALAFGQGTAHFFVSLFLMLYLLFFFLRDGVELAKRFKDAIPLRTEMKSALFNKFTVVIRALFKGSMVVAVLQGALGGTIFWLLGIHAPILWGVMMAFLSLLPAVGAALIWLPVAIYFLVIGSLWKGAILLTFGLIVISLVDNVLRPILVGMDTKMPDHVVLISTLGGIAVFGIEGLVIGPVIAAMFIAAWGIFAEQSNPKSRTAK